WRRMTIHYQSSPPSPERGSRSRKGCRDAAILLAGAGALLGCWAYGRFLEFATGLKYIDRAATKPHTPEDEHAFQFAAALPYVGWGIMGLSLLLLIGLKAGEEWFPKRPPLK